MPARTAAIGTDGHFDLEITFSRSPPPQSIATRLPRQVLHAAMPARSGRPLRRVAPVLFALLTACVNDPYIFPDTTVPELVAHGVSLTTNGEEFPGGMPEQNTIADEEGNIHVYQVDHPLYLFFLPDDRFADTESMRRDEIDHVVSFVTADGRSVTALNDEAFFDQAPPPICVVVDDCSGVRALDFEELEVNGDFVFELFPIAIPEGATRLEVRAYGPGVGDGLLLHAVALDRLEGWRRYFDG